jgi:hypothetical protein
MSVLLTKRPDWKQVLDGKARLVHQQIASLQRWVEQAGGGEKMLEELTAPYYELLRSIYEEDFPLSASNNKGPTPRIRDMPRRRRSELAKIDQIHRDLIVRFEHLIKFVGEARTKVRKRVLSRKE